MPLEAAKVMPFSVSARASMRVPNRSRAILLTSHDPLVVESDVVQRVIDMRDGRLIDEH